MKRIIIVIMMLLKTIVFSQEIKLVFNSGFYSVLQIENKLIDVTNKYGASFGASYSYKLDKNYGITSSLQFSTYGSNIGLKSPKIKSNEIDDTGTGFLLEVTTKGYQESLVLNSLEIPLKLFFDTNSQNKKKIGYYAGVGLKLLIPLKQKSTIQMKGVTLKGHYPDTNTTVKDLKRHGFGEWDENYQSVQPINLSSSIALTSELGMSFKINDETFYIGIYGDYGITDMHKKKEIDGTLIKYNPKGQPKEAMGITNLKGNSGINLLNCGIQIKYSLKKGKHY